MSDPKAPKETSSSPEAPAPTPAGCEEAPAPRLSGASEVNFPSQFARLFFGVITLIVLYYSYELIKPYLIDIFLALVLFLTAKPLHRGLTRLLWGQRALASALTCFFLAVLILLPFFALVSIIANQALEFSSWVRQELQSDQLWQWVSVKTDAIKEYLLHLKLPLPPEQIKLDNLIRSLLTKASGFVYDNAVGLLKGFTSFFIDLLIVLFIAFFMFLQGDDFIREIKKLSPLDPVHNEEILGEMEATIKATLWGTVVVAFVQGILGGVGFLLFGVPKAAFWGTVMIPASVIPLVGNAIIWFPGCIYLFFQGSVAKSLGLFFWCLVLISSIDNVLKPWLMKGARSTPAIFILFSILGGLSYFGMIGFILGPLILSFLLSLLNIYRKTILTPATVPVRPPSPENEKPIVLDNDGL